MKGDAYLYGIGLVFVAAISALLISGTAQRNIFGVQETEEVALPTEIARRVILSSPYGR
jgi:hypothetical protein